MTTGHNRRYIPPSFLLVEAIFYQDRPPQYYETVKIFECYSIMVSQSVILHHVPNHLNNLNRGQLCIWNRNNWDHLTIRHPFMKLTSIGFKSIFNICLNQQMYIACHHRSSLSSTSVCWVSLPSEALFSILVLAPPPASTKVVAGTVKDLMSKSANIRVVWLWIWIMWPSRNRWMVRMVQKHISVFVGHFLLVGPIPYSN